MVAPPHSLFIFGSCMPGFRSVPGSALTAFDFAGEFSRTRARAASFPNVCKFGLNEVPHRCGHDRLMVASDIVLGYFAFVLELFLGQEVSCVALLKERVSFVFLVGQDVADPGDGPGCSSFRGFVAVVFEVACDPGHRVTFKEQLIDQADCDRLFRIDDEVAVLAFVVAEKVAEGTETLPSAKRLRWPQVTFSEMEQASSCASELMMVISSSPLTSEVQMFSFSK